MAGTHVADYNADVDSTSIPSPGRKAAWDKVMADPRMKPEGNPMPFDGKRMIYGGFEPIIER